MDVLQQRMIVERFAALADILKEIGPEFDLSVPDSNGDIWRFNVSYMMEKPPK